mmetsp:Transcript_11381/g.32199  ORF Transcript_11381/g.32199 Transcript_11381/m.32199 type:complete len:488 (+) Transcript_11381:1488-2951(+)
MKVGPGAGGRHETVLGHLRPRIRQLFHLLHDFSRLGGRRRCIHTPPTGPFARAGCSLGHLHKSLGPMAMDKVHVPGKLRLGHQFRERRLAELERDDIQRPGPVLPTSFKIVHILLQGVRRGKLGGRIDDLDGPVRSDQLGHVGKGEGLAGIRIGGWDLEAELFRRHVHKQNGMGETVPIGIVGIEHDLVPVGRRASRRNRQQTSADARLEDAPLLPLADHVLEVHLLHVAGGNADVGGVLVVQDAPGVVELDEVDPAALAQSRPGALVLRRAVVRDAGVAVPGLVRGGLGGGQAEGGGVVPGLAGIAGNVEGLVGGIVHQNFVLPEASGGGGGGRCRATKAKVFWTTESVQSGQHSAIEVLDRQALRGLLPERGDDHVPGDGAGCRMVSGTPRLSEICHFLRIPALRSILDHIHVAAVVVNARLVEALDGVSLCVRHGEGKGEALRELQLLPVDVGAWRCRCSPWRSVVVIGVVVILAGQHHGCIHP